MSIPADADARRAKSAAVCYPVESLPQADMAMLGQARKSLTKISEVIVPPRDGRAFDIPAGHFFRIASIEGPQVGDLNLWNAHDLNERFFSGKTRALRSLHQPAAVGRRLSLSLSLEPVARARRRPRHERSRR